MAKKSRKLRVAVIFGGRSSEHEVSLVSAQSIITALNPNTYDIIPIGITKSGTWLSGRNALLQFKMGQKRELVPIVLNPDPCEKWRRPFDVAFPVLHGPYGEDGTIQGFLELAGIPYVGSGVLASAVCMDKFMTKVILKSYGLPQTNFLHCTRREIKKDFTRVKKCILRDIGLPCFVKPSNLGSSIGISKVKKVSKLLPALLFASSYDSSILVEEAIDAREIECAVLGNENPIASVAGEIIPSNEFYDYFAKYIDNASTLIIPARISRRKMQEVAELSLKAYRALECSGMARVDFLMDKKTGKLYLNELNTIPGFTSISMYPKLLEASGIPYSKLLDRLIALALERYKEKQKNKVTFESGTEWYKRNVSQ